MKMKKGPGRAIRRKVNEVLGFMPSQRTSFYIFFILEREREREREREER
jgi:hypothetical protein